MIAVQCGDERMTYEELLRHASYVSQQLAVRGVGVGHVILMNPSRHVDTVIILLGIMLRGATVCPLDFFASDARVCNILKASRAGFIVISDKTPLGETASQLLQSFQIETILVERAGEKIPTVENLSTLETGCYLLFTSGTTGEPKGVLMSNHGLANLIQWDILFRKCQPGRVHLQFASFHFDIAFHELFSAISSGGTSVLATQEQRQDPGLLLELLSSSGIEKAYLPYSILSQLALAASGFAKSLYLTDVTTAGEPLKITEAIRSFFHRTRALLYNNYGSTEVQDVTSLELAGDPLQWPDLPSIGVPIAGMEVGVLTQNGISSDPGSEGRIVVKGCQVAMGYMQPDADDLLPLPSTSAGEIDEYLTGDLGIILPDGSIAITGRTDRQVKIRGKRVDVAAVETTIERSRYVKQAAVVATDISGRAELVAFVTAAEETRNGVLEEDMRALITDALDATAVPYLTHTLSAFPETSTGKVDRQALEAMASSLILAPPRRFGKLENLQLHLSEIWNDVLPGGKGRSFRAAGGDSLSAMQLVTRLKQELQIDISVADISDETTLDSILKVAKSRASTAKNEPAFASLSPRKAVAIIGMAGRFPGADSVGALWEGLLSNQIFFSDSKNDPPPLSESENFVRTGGFLDHHDYFDAEFFGISEREALLMDPQHRIFLECSWHALENAGYAPNSVPYRTGVYSASGASTYLINSILPKVMNGCDGPFLSHRLIRNVGEIFIEQGNSPEHVSMRVSNKLNLIGPSLSIGSACSGGLVAVHYAVQAIRLGEAEMALAGGVSISTPQHVGYFAHDGVILSPTGCCRPFDAEADGAVFGNGCSVLVLKDYDLAVRDGDQIIAVIVGSAVNNDGARKLSYTGPSVEGQIDVINAALADAGLSASDIDYIEAHGTGTPVGDSIELTALAATYGAVTAAENCLVGSLKANIGHLDEAAGAAGLLKAALCANRGKIPGIPTFRNAHERMPLQGTRLRIAKGEAQNWNCPPGRPRRAAVSSLGIGGTNCHVILEGRETLVRSRQEPSGPQQKELFVLSAGSSEQLIALCRKAYELLAESDQNLDLRDLCMTYCVGRRPERFRIGCAVSSKAELSQFLDDVIRGVLSPSDSLAPTKKVGLFTGQGCQWTRMGKELSGAFPTFRKAMEDCFEYMRSSHGIDVKQVIEEASGQDAKLNRTQFTQPAIFAFEYAMTCLLRSFGVQFEEVAGHSFGEIAALVAAGVLSLKDACFLVCERGRLVGELPSGLGAMAVVRGSAEDVALLVSKLSDGVTVAAFNSPTAVVLSGNASLVAEFTDAGEVLGCTVTPLPVSHAGHSEQMRPIVEEYRSVIAKLPFSEPLISIVSSVTGAPLRGNIDWIEYFTDHLVRPVRFHDVLQYILRDRSKIFIELGPKPMLLGLGMESQPDDDRTWIASCSSSDELATFLRALAELFNCGVNLRFENLAPRGPWRRVSLPTYPFRRKQYLCAPPFVSPERQTIQPVLPDANPKLLRRERRTIRKVWFGEHMVNGVCIVPGTYLLDVVAQEASAALGTPCVEIQKFRIHSMVTADVTQGTILEIDLMEGPELCNLMVEMKQLPLKGNGQPVRVVSARAKRGTLPDGAPVRAEEGLSEVLPELVYQRYEAQGVSLGEAFKCIASMSAAETSGSSQCHLPLSLRDDGEYFGVHPVLVDSALQVIEAVFRDGHSGGAFVPVGIDRVLMLQESATATVCDVRNCRRSGGESLFDFTIRNLAGHVIMAGEGFRQIEIGHEAGGNLDDRQPSPKGCLTIREEVLAPQDLPTVGPFRRMYGAIASILPNDIQDPNLDLPMVGLWKGRDSAEITKELANTDYLIIPVDIFLSPVAQVDQELEYALATMSSLFGSLADAFDSGISIPIVMISRRNYPDVTSAGIAEAAFSFARSFATETDCPRLLCVQLENVNPKSLRGLVSRELECSLEGIAQVVIHDGEQRAVVHLQEISSGSQLVDRLDAAASYLVTGGLGSIGPVLVQALGENGARHIHVLSRSIPTGERLTAIKEVEATGCTVSVHTVDVSDCEALAACLEKIQAERPIRGIIHAAGRLADGLISSIDRNDIARVVPPKAGGAVNLHSFFNEPGLLDFFVLCSSTASSRGEAGQALHAAACGFLDGLSRYRNQIGLTATSINWGVWKESTAFVNNAELSRRYFDRGDAGLSNEQGAAALGVAIARKPSRLEALNVASSKGPNFGKVNLSLPTDNVSDQEQSEADVLRRVMQRIATLLGSGDASGIDPDLEWRDLGLDSLLLIELRNELRKHFGAFVSSTIIMSSGTPRRLSAKISEASSLSRSKLVHYQVEDVRLLLIPSITGEPMDFSGLIPLLGNIPFEVLEYPNDIDPWRTSLQPRDVIAPLTARAKNAAGDKPVVLLGYSFGGKIANEIGLELHRQGVEVRRVLILDIPADASPRVLVEDSAVALPLNQDSFNAMLVKNPVEAFKALDLACQNGKVEESLRHTASIYWSNAAIAPQLEASKTPLPLTFVRAARVGALHNLLPGAHLSTADPTWGWNEVGRDVEVHVVDGDHFSIMRSDKVSQIADIVNEIFQVH
ncbi:PKS/SDR/adenylate forming domain-containing protein (plasmid) [Rhizobium gallicum]|uniref:PKS/SDR/adenylate forming domain-containing protein n=1 Tax=Rhizobium gallicum TaxID=56730 RepID=A0A1L5NPM6_9HYPH|nr:type I polyketide synthase [Rhizobium gallicum]APO69846.1 PKS/SDR/adenylate forming domain-containing protein [Rhizobium gallicum]